MKLKTIALAKRVLKHNWDDRSEKKKAMNDNDCDVTFSKKEKVSVDIRRISNVKRKMSASKHYITSPSRGWKKWAKFIFSGHETKFCISLYGRVEFLRYETSRFLNSSSPNSNLLHRKEMLSIPSIKKKQFGNVDFVTQVWSVCKISAIFLCRAEAEHDATFEGWVEIYLAFHHHAQNS
mgnify:CR=1 FL=1